MGRKLNLSHLTEEESEQILQVIQKDFELRQKEKQRLSLIEDVVQQEEEKAAILSRQKEFNENCCIRCCKVFGFIFNRRRLCTACKFYVCKDCGRYMDNVKGYVCDKCLVEHNLKLKSCDWFYSTVGQRFRRFGSAKVVRSLYKCKNAKQSENSGIRLAGSDSEVDSGYDPSYFNSAPHSPVKLRRSLQEVFDIHPSHDDSELPVPSHRTPVHDKPVVRASSLETLVLPSSQKESSLRSGQPVKEKRDIYKEAFESAKQAEENKFKTKFDRLVTELNSALAHLPPSSVTSPCSTPSYGDVLITYRGRMKELILIFEQRLRLAYESFDQPVPDESTTQRVKQNVSRLVEDLLGETLDLTSDEAVSDLSSLSDESGTEQNSFEDQIAQVIVSKLLEGHQKNHQSNRYTPSKSRLPNNLGNYDLRPPADEVDSSSDILRDFEELRDFVRQTQQTRPTALPRELEEQLGPLLEEPPVSEEPVERIHLDTAERTSDDFLTRCSSIDRVRNSHFPLPDFSDLDSIDFTSNEIDPDLLSMNLASIPEETEEELEDDDASDEGEGQGVGDGEGGERRWGENWVFKGALSPYDNCGRRRVGNDMDKPLYMMVPNPEDNYVPKVGNRDADELSDLSDTETKSTDDLSDEENTFYARTSEELARISRKHSRSSSVQSDSDLDADRSSSSTYKRRVESILQKSGDAGRESEAVKLVEMLMPAENDDPKFVMLPESCSVLEGEPLKLSCVVAGTPPIDVFWYHEDQEVTQLEDSEDCDIHTDGDRHAITLFNLSKTQSGQYMCIALSDQGKATKYFTITVTNNKQDLKKPEFIKGIQDVDIKEGQSVKFRCKVKGYPQPRVVWYKDGKLLKSSRSCRIEKFGNRDYLLTIDHATLDDDAEYTVMARNVAGETKSSAQVIVDSDVFDETRPDKTHGWTDRPISDDRTNHGTTLSNKIITSRNNITEVAENMLGTAQEMTHLSDDLDAVDRDLDVIESSLTRSTSDERNNNVTIGDTSPLEAVDDYRAKEKAASGVRLLTSSALDMLWTANEIIRHEKEDSCDSFLTSTPRESGSTGSGRESHTNNYSSLSNKTNMDSFVTSSPRESGSTGSGRESHTNNYSSLSNKTNMDSFVTSSPRESGSTGSGRESHNNNYSSEQNVYSFPFRSRSENISGVGYQAQANKHGLDSDERTSHGSGILDDRTSLHNTYGSSVLDDRTSLDNTHGSSVLDDRTSLHNIYGSGILDDRTQKNESSYSELRNIFSNHMDDSVSEHGSSKAPLVLSEMNLDLSGKDNSSLTTMDKVDGDTNNSVDEGVVCNFGPKSIDSDKYNRDFESKESKRKKWEVKLDHYSPRAEIVNRKQNLQHTEEQIYMTAGNVFSLEDRVRDLEHRVKGDNQLSNQQMSALQKEVAKAVVQVEHNENEVNSIEKAVIGLQESSSLSPSQNSPRADTSSQLSSRRQSFDSGISSLREKVEPVRLVGHTGEDEVPESRGEYDADSGIELPSVNRLRAMFSSSRKEDDLGEGNFKRNDSDGTIHSITARSVSKEQLEKLRGSKLHTASPLAQHEGAPTSPSGSSPTLRSSSTLQFSFSEPSNESTPQAAASQANLRPPTREASRDKDTPPFSRSDSLSDSLTFRDLEPLKDPVLIYPESDERRRSSIPDDSTPHASKPHASTPHASMPHAMTASQTAQQTSKPGQKLSINLSSCSSSTPSPKSMPTSIQATKSGAKSQTEKDSSDKTKSPKIRSGSISARTAFWEKRITEGSVNDYEIEGEFPDITSDEDKL